MPTSVWDSEIDAMRQARIAKHRRSLGATVPEIAAKLGVSHQRVIRLLGAGVEVRNETARAARYAARREAT